MKVPTTETPAIPNNRFIRWADGSTRIILALFIIVTIFLVGGFARFSWAVVDYRPQNNLHADAIVVLTGGKQRVETALKLLRQKHASRMLISGVNPNTTIASLKATFSGDPETYICCIDLDHQATDTGENAKQTARWTNTHNFKSLIIVTSNYHMPRAIIELSRNLKGIELYPYAVAGKEFADGTWLTQPKLLRVMASEYLKTTAASLHLTRAHIGMEIPVANSSGL